MVCAKQGYDRAGVRPHRTAGALALSQRAALSPLKQGF